MVEIKQKNSKKIQFSRYETEKFCKNDTKEIKKKKDKDLFKSISAHFQHFQFLFQKAKLI